MPLAPPTDSNRTKAPASVASAAAVLAIDLDAIAANWRLLNDRVGNTTCGAAIKADAYGLGMDQVGPALAAAGCEWFFVAHLDEGVRLRALVPDAKIGVLNGLMHGAEALYGAHDLVPVLNGLDDIARYARMAAAAGHRLPAIIHIDTGMNRLGLGLDELPRLIDDPARIDGIEVLYWLSHFASADDAATGQTEAQYNRFIDALARLPAARASLANSSGIFRGDKMWFDLVRPGCALYGMNPVPEAENPMQAVVRLEARILQTRNVGTGEAVGYGATWTAQKPSRISTISTGYADGFMRSISSRGTVMFGDIAAPVVGRVSMDLITVDTSEVPPALSAPGRMAGLLTPRYTIDDMARDAGTIGYEVLTGLGARYTRIYRSSNEGAGE